MNLSRWMVVGMLLGTGWAGAALAEGPPGPQCLPPPHGPAPWPGPSAPGPVTPGQPQAPQAPGGASPQTQQQGAGPADTGGLTPPGTDVGGVYSSAFATATGGTSSVGSVGATATGDALNIAPPGTIGLSVRSTSTAPLILPGLLTSAEVQPALPTDRVYFNYAYLSGFRVGGGIVGPPSTQLQIPPNSFFIQDVTGTHVPLTSNNFTLTGLPANLTSSQVTPTHKAFNLNIYTGGVEKTFLDGRASVYVSAPVLDATDNTSGQPIDGFSDINAGLKFALLGDPETGSAITVGFTASAPTARDAIFITSTTSQFNVTATAINPATGQPIPQGTGEPGTTVTARVDTITPVGKPVVQTVKINPTYLQPWLGGLLVRDRLFAQAYSGALVPTDDRIPVYLNEDLVVGYEVYRGPHDALLASVAPFLGTQVLVPVSGSEFRFPTQVFLSAGLGVRLGQRLLLSGSYITPVAGPKGFDDGFTIGANYFF